MSKAERARSVSVGDHKDTKQEKQKKKEEEEEKKKRRGICLMLCCAGCAIGHFFGECLKHKSMRTFDLTCTVLLVYSVVCVTTIVAGDLSEDLEDPQYGAYVAGSSLMLVGSLCSLMSKCGCFELGQLVGTFLALMLVGGSGIFFLSYILVGCELSDQDCGYKCVFYYAEPVLAVGTCALFAEQLVTRKLLDDTDLRIRCFSRLLVVFSFMISISLFEVLHTGLDEGEFTLLVGSTAMLIVLLLFFTFPRCLQHKVFRILVGAALVICGLIIFSGYLAYLENFETDNSLDELNEVSVGFLALFVACVVGQDMILVEVKKLEGDNKNGHANK